MSCSHGEFIRAVFTTAEGVSMDGIARRVGAGYEPFLVCPVDLVTTQKDNFLCWLLQILSNLTTVELSEAFSYDCEECKKVN